MAVVSFSFRPHPIMVLNIKGNGKADMSTRTVRICDNNQLKLWIMFLEKIELKRSNLCSSEMRLGSSCPLKLLKGKEDNSNWSTNCRG